ncbi:LysR substrate-binding domain-containing protein [Mesorhizobium sp. NPDC059025]|uniref:LysR substrate-binding domain-containing protein n=1 Tax=unclassified Mesorhizobium TaxID=325217 RepID=UPI003689C179
MEIDLAIIHAEAPPEGYENLLIAKDILSPVASPTLAGTLDEPSDLLRVPLIHDERPLGWADWLRGAGVDANGSWHGSNFSDCDLALAAAELGQGVALGSLPLVEVALATRALVHPYGYALETGRAWYALSTRDRLRDVDVQGVWDWLAGQAMHGGDR